MKSYSGIANGAKIAFFDIGDSTGRLSVPSNLGFKMFPPGTTQATAQALLGEAHVERGGVYRCSGW